MGWLFKTNEEKLAKKTQILRLFIKNRRDLASEMEESRKMALENSQDWDRIAEVENNLANIAQQLEKAPANRELLQRRNDLTRELKQLTAKALEEDKLYVMMRYEQKLLDIDRRIKNLEKDIAKLEAPQA